MSWKEKDLKKGNLPPKSRKNKRKRGKKGKLPSTPKTRNKGKESINLVLFALKSQGIIPDYIEEHRFHPVRRWRFDWAIPSLKVSIEYEGIISRKSRHTTLKGFSGDCEKYNAAAILGWKVMRYTAMNYQYLAEDLKQIAEQNPV